MEKRIIFKDDATGIKRIYTNIDLQLAMLMFKKEIQKAKQNGKRDKKASI